MQIALVIAKAARFDFPQQWPTLFNDLLAGVSNSSAAPAGQQLSQQQQVLLVRRTYFVLHHVLKELSSKRLAADQKAFAQVCCGVCWGVMATAPTLSSTACCRSQFGTASAGLPAPASNCCMILLPPNSCGLRRHCTWGCADTAAGQGKQTHPHASNTPGLATCLAPKRLLGPNLHMKPSKKLCCWFPCCTQTCPAGHRAAV